MIFKKIKQIKYKFKMILNKMKAINSLKNINKRNSCSFKNNNNLIKIIIKKFKKYKLKIKMKI